MLNDLAALEAKQVERDHRRAVTSDAVVSGMQQYEISVHKRAIDCYVSGGRASDVCGKGLHSSNTTGDARIMLYERFGKIPIDCSRIFLAKDIDHGFASLGAQSVRNRTQVQRCLARCRLSQAR